MGSGEWSLEVVPSAPSSALSSVSEEERRSAPGKGRVVPAEGGDGGGLPCVWAPSAPSVSSGEEACRKPGAPRAPIAAAAVAAAAVAAAAVTAALELLGPRSPPRVPLRDNPRRSSESAAAGAPSVPSASNEGRGLRSPLKVPARRIPPHLFAAAGAPSPSVSDEELLVEALRETLRRRPTPPAPPS